MQDSESAPRNYPKTTGISLCEEKNESSRVGHLGVTLCLSDADPDTDTEDADVGCDHQQMKLSAQEE
ncbi:hypothetical protein AVEN_252572-1 [Araneus ventricosus]|uniref:Uncharacterized protein n=1 Tax=Araneus ventricosus TaxID=182803 RepID=A0A4Y2ATB8_ARAVE|nr:hypothetical protein AVEN_252572-1 [Araneus ventricosus]